MPQRDRIAVFGLYKTGTTALYSNIRQALPYTPRTMFEADHYVAVDGDSESGVLAKVIVGQDNTDYASFAGFDKKILLVRDPRDWIISGCLFLTQEIEEIYRSRARTSRIISLLEQKESTPREIPFTRILEVVVSHSRLQTLPALLSWTRDVLGAFRDFETGIQPGLRLRYEDFVDRDVQALAGYLGVSVPDRFSVDSEFSHVSRTNSHGAWKSWFTREDVEVFQPVFSPFLRQYGYGADWRLDEHPLIAPEHGSGYVARVVDRKRAMDAAGSSAQ